MWRRVLVVWSASRLAVLSLGYLLELVEEVQSDIAALDRSAPELPSIGVSGEIRVPVEQRQAFLDDLQRTLRELFRRYGGAGGDAFKLAVAPKLDELLHASD